MTEIAPHDFDIVGAIAGTAAPQDSVIVHTDGQALFDLTSAEAIINAAPFDEEGVKVQEERSRAAQARLKESAVEIVIKPIPTPLREELVAKYRAEFQIGDDTTDEQYTAFIRTLENEILSGSIISITRVRDGAVQPGPYSPATVQGLRGLPGGYFDKIVDKYETLLLEQVVYTGNAEDPNFS